MLAQAVKSNLNDINNLKMRSKTSAFGKLFQIATPVVDSISEIENDIESIIESNIVEDEVFDNYVELDVENDYNPEDYVIVEDPNQVVVEFPIVSDIKLEHKLPFFKSISFKLASL